MCIEKKKKYLNFYKFAHSVFGYFKFGIKKKVFNNFHNYQNMI